MFEERLITCFLSVAGSDGAGPFGAAGNTLVFGNFVHRTEFNQWKRCVQVQLWFVHVWLWSAAVWLKLVLWGRLRTGQLRGRRWWYEYIFLFIFWVNLTELLNEMMDNISGGRNKVARQQINKPIGLKAARKQNKLKWINEDVSVSSCSLSVCRSKNETRSLNLYRWRTSVCSSHVGKLLLIIYM